jgi:protein tyrosine phosphatase (PTP) superfamily phosphohydrolase (DUF442 family)
MRVLGSMLVLLALALLVAAGDPPADGVRDFPGLHNVVSYQGKGGAAFYSGGAPEGDAGFDALAKLGIKTIVSVDGALPDLERAKARGMRYVHLPIGYDGFDDARKAELVRAVRDLPKPLFVHCHHGKHRSAGAAATVAVSLGWMTNAEAAARMKVSGTAEGYKGLWSCTAKAAPMMAAAIEAARADFPEVTRPDSMVAAMVAADEALERIKRVEKNGWKAPADHPDLAPAADAGKIADLLRLLDGDGHVATLCESDRASFRALLEANARQAGALEELLAAKSADVARLSAAMKDLNAGCKACHVKHRD